VGGNAQVPAMKKIAGSLRLDLAAFRELEAFAQLGTELDPATQRQLDRGRRMVELLKQPQYRPMDVWDQILAIHAGVRGFLDDVPLHRVHEFAEKLLRHYHDEYPELREQLARERTLSDPLDAKLKEIVGNFKRRFVEPKQ